MKVLRLGDLCEILNGFAFKSEKYVEDGIRIIRIANVQKGFIDDSQPAFYPKDTMGIEKYMLNEGDLLLSLTGNVGRVAILTQELLPAALNQRVACLRVKNNDITVKYLYHILNSYKFELDCIMASNGVAQKNMSTEWLKNYPIPVFDKDEQESIVDKLEKIQQIISQRKEQLVDLDLLVKSQFIEMFGDIYSTDKWDKYAWADLVTIRNGKDYKNIAVEQGGYPVYGTGGEMARASAYLCPENTIIVGRKGTINNPLLVKEKFWNVDTAFGVIVGEKLHYQYFYWFCKMFDFSALNKQAVLPSTTKADLLKIKMPVPPIELQKQYARFVEQTDKSKIPGLKQRNNLIILRNWISTTKTMVKNVKISYNIRKEDVV